MTRAERDRAVMRRDDPDFLVFYAKTLLREAAARRHHRGAFHAILLEGAAKARRDLSLAKRPPQGDLFSRLGGANAP